MPALKFNSRREKKTGKASRQLLETMGTNRDIVFLLLFDVSTATPNFRGDVSTAAPRMMITPSANITSLRNKFYLLSLSLAMRKLRPGEVTDVPKGDIGAW